MNEENDEDFGEEFEIEDDVLAPEEGEGEQPSAETPQPKKSNLLPILIGAGVMGFVGWKLYGMFLAPKSQTKIEVAKSSGQEPTIQKIQSGEKQPTGKPSPATPGAGTSAPKGMPSIAETPPAVAPASPKTQPEAVAHETPTAPAPSATPPAEQPMAPTTAAATPSAETAPATTATAPTGTIPAATLPSAPIATTSPQGSIPTTPAAAPVASGEIDKLQKHIEAQEKIIKDHLAELEKDVESASQNSANTNKGIGALQQEVASLAAAVKQLHSELRSIHIAQEKSNAIATARQIEKAKEKAKPKISPKSEAFTTPNISIHAIIPGRAWLRTTDGKTLTVTEGDIVGEYGKVIKIDAPNGVVVTSSGVTLR